MPWGAAIGAAVSYVSSRNASKAQKEAAYAQMNAQERIAQDTLDFQTEQFDYAKEILGPYQEFGLRGLENYEQRLANYSPQDLPKFLERYKGPGEFTGNVDVTKDPGYQFRLDQGLQALDRMFAKGGERFSGKRGIGLQQYAQDYASQEYGNAYNRELQKWQLETGRAEADYSRALGLYNLDYQRQKDIQANQLGHLALYGDVASMGSSASGALSNLGSGYASQYGATNAGLSAGVANSLQAAGDARAAGYLGAGNAVNSGLAAYNYNSGFRSGTGGNTGPWGSSSYYQGDKYDVYQDNSGATANDGSAYEAGGGFSGGWMN